MTINISLNPELAEFARTDLEANAYGSMSECMRALIRRRRQELIEKDVATLQQATNQAPNTEPTAEEYREIYSTIRARRKRR